MLTVIYILHITSGGTETPFRQKHQTLAFIPTVHFVHMYQNRFVWSQSLLLWPRLCATGFSVFWIPACRAGKSQRISHAPSPSSSGTSNRPQRWCLETWQHQHPTLTETFWFSVQSVREKHKIKSAGCSPVCAHKLRSTRRISPDCLTGSFIPVPSLPSPSPFFQPIFSNILRPLLTSLISLWEEKHKTLNIYICYFNSLATVKDDMLTREQKQVHHLVGKHLGCPPSVV